MRKFSLALALLCGFTGLAAAQQGSLIQQSGSRLDAATNVAVGTNFNTINTISVATAQPPAGQYAYITGIAIEYCGDLTGTVSTNGNVTSTGIVGTPSWSYSATTASSLSTCTRQVDQLAIPLKGTAPGTPVVLTGPQLAHTGVGIRIYWYAAP